MKQLTMNEINEVSGGPVPAWVIWAAGTVTGHLAGRAIDNVFSAFNNWAIANSTPSWTYAQCVEYMDSLPNGSIE